MVEATSSLKKDGKLPKLSRHDVDGFKKFEKTNKTPALLTP